MDVHQLIWRDCGKFCSSKKNLANHQRVHNKFACNLCDKIYTRKVNLNIHIQKVHQQQEDPAKELEELMRKTQAPSSKECWDTVRDLLDDENVIESPLTSPPIQQPIYITHPQYSDVSSTEDWDNTEDPETANLEMSTADDDSELQTPSSRNSETSHSTTEASSDEDSDTTMLMDELPTPSSGNSEASHSTTEASSDDHQ